MADFWNTIIKISNAFNDMFRTQDMAAYIINNWGNVAGYVLAGLCIVLGVILALIGARALKVSAILLSLWLGIIIGRGVLYPIVEAHSTLTAEWQTALKWILPAVLSIILIFATYKVAKVACFVCGGLCGFMSDLLGCFILGYPPNPLIMVTAVLWGVFPGLARKMLAGQDRKRKTAVITASIALAGLIGSIGFTTAGLVLLLGYNFYVIFPGRVIQTIIMAIMYSAVCCVLYFSPLTAQFFSGLQPYGRKESAE